MCLSARPDQAVKSFLSVTNKNQLTRKLFHFCGCLFPCLILSSEKRYALVQWFPHLRIRQIPINISVSFWPKVKGKSQGCCCEVPQEILLQDTAPAISNSHTAKYSSRRDCYSVRRSFTLRKRHTIRWKQNQRLHKKLNGHRLYY